MKLPAKTVACAAFLLAATSACAHAQDRVLPPLQYDHPFTDGFFIIRRGSDEASMRQLCPMPPPFGYPRLGCAYKNQIGCLVVLTSDEMIRAAGHDPAIVLRHERGHCWGWPPTHEGARPADAPEGK